MSQGERSAMTGIKYQLTSETICDCGERITVFGIRVTENGRELVNYPHICFDKQRLAQIVYLCNYYKAYPIHLPGIVDDLLGDHI